MKRLWLLQLVFDGTYGRWLSAIVIFAAMLLWLVSAGVFEAGRIGVSIGAFFCVVVAYVVPIFHFITQRTQSAFDELSWHLSIDAHDMELSRQSITHKSWSWVLLNASLATTFWLLQSFMLAGSGARLVEAITSNYASSVASLAPLVVWLTITCVLHALIDNARLFRRLARQHKVDLLNVEVLKPFGRMAVSSTLVVIGVQASFSIMWLGESISIWTTLPGLVLTTAALVFLFLAPVWPVHLAVKNAKMQELRQVQDQIGALRERGEDDLHTLNGWLTYRREIMSVAEWPFDLGLMARLGLYLVVVPLTWIGAALIEIAVDMFVA